jgi:hypothetical protein
MSALAKTDYAPWSLSEEVVADFIRKGAHVFDDRLDGGGCSDLLAQIRAARRLDENLFLSEAEFDAGAQCADLDPRPGRNLLERLESRLGFVERSPQIVEALWSLLGPDYRILDKTVVCGLPTSAIPDWVKRRMRGDPANDLGVYVRPEHRDVSYSHGVDFQQDLAGDEAPEGDVVTLHVYLHPVTEQEAPLRLMEGSHRLGGTVFPHDLKRTGPDGWRYRNGRFGEMYLTERVLTGETGLAVLWHPCLLHGAQPADHERVSLRYLIARGDARSAGIDAVNASLAGPLG